MGDPLWPIWVSQLQLNILATMRIAIGVVLALLATSCTRESPTTDGDTACDVFRDELPGPDVAVRVVNGRADPIFVVVHANYAFFSLYDPLGASPTWRVDGWTPSCESHLDGGPLNCGGCICNEVAIRVDPGAELLDRWTGSIYQELQMEDACSTVDNDYCGPDCVQAIAPAAGQWTFAAAAAESIACGNGDCPACEPGPTEGTCSVVAHLDRIFYNDPLPDATATIEYPAHTEVALRFE